MVLEYEPLYPDLFLLLARLLGPWGLASVDGGIEPLVSTGVMGSWVIGDDRILYVWQLGLA
jgi:hypothetical protein